MRLSLAETGQIRLTKPEESALRRAVSEFISIKAREIARLQEQGDRIAI